MDPLSLFMIAALALLVMFMVRNSKKQRESQQQLQEKLQPGAEVMTSFGLFAHLVSIDEETNVAVIDIGSGNLMRVHRQTLTKVVEPETDEEPEDASSDDVESRNTEQKDS